MQAAEAAAEQAKQKLINAAKTLATIAMDELGITAALDCFTGGDLGACAETALTVASSFVGGLAGKLMARYGAPWRWAKGASLVKRVWNTLSELVSGVKQWWDKSRLAKRLTQASCNSFAPGTAVLLADGTSKPVEELEVGDVVVATDPETGETAAKTVAATIIGHGMKNLVEITVDTDGADGQATDALIATDGHPFWVPDLREWLDATDLQSGQWLQTSTGTWVQITAVKRWTQTATVYNLTVTDIHTYYVIAGDTPVLVHNCGEAALDDVGEAYVRKNHMPGGAGVDETKGVFNPTEDLYKLADDSNNFPAVPQLNGNCARVCDAGREIGRTAQDQGGLPTTIYTVITDKFGGVITMHPGVPR